MSENQVVNACIKWLFANKCFVWRNNSGAYKPEGSKRFIRYGCKGSPDIIGMTPSGRFIGVECKYGKGKLTEPQERFGENIESSNGIFIVAYSIDDLEANKEVICSTHY